MSTFSASNLEEIEATDSIATASVFGYIRTVEQELLKNKTNTYFIIPKQVIYLCLLYYIMDEQFSAYGSHVKCYNNNCNIRLISNKAGYRTIYGLKLIDPMKPFIHKWKLKIVKCVSFNLSNRKFDS